MRRSDVQRWTVSVLLALTGCGGSGEDGKSTGRPERVVIYTALDREFSEPILSALESRTGVLVDAKYDVESTKTVGLTNALLAEAGRPRADLFWNNEILNTLRLKREGLLLPFSPIHMEAIPDQYKARDGTWYGFAGRARILIVNTKLVPEQDWPSTILDLADPRWKGRAGIAKPLFGTTASHAACLFEAWGETRARRFFRDLKENEVRLLSGNKQVAQDVASGRLAFGLTDTDDAMVMIEQQKAPVTIVYPDQEEGGLGTLFIPNTLVMIRGGLDSEAADELASLILSPEVESTLAAGPSAQIPLLSTTEASARVATPETINAMQVDFESAAERWDEVAAFMRDEFSGG